jgi:hypothetical protein
MNIDLLSRSEGTIMRVDLIRVLMIGIENSHYENEKIITAEILEIPIMIFQ